MMNNSEYPVEKMCKCMRVSKNAYYNWVNNEVKPKEITATMYLKDRIRALFYESKEIYGSPRIQQMLARENLLFSRSYIARLMNEMGLKSVLRRKFTVTTDSDHAFEVYRNVLDRNFTSYRIGERWVSDITYVRVNDDWCYLTAIIDLADRKIVGWSLSEDMTTENTVLQAWVSARNTREIKEGFVFHSDRGVQYASNKITKLLSLNIKASQSMSRKGNCWDNAVAESFFKTIKYECLYRHKFSSYRQLYSTIKEYIIWYNTKRLHSSLGYLSPLEKEIELMNFIKKVA